MIYQPLPAYFIFKIIILKVIMLLTFMKKYRAVDAPLIVPKLRILLIQWGSSFEANVC